MDAVNAEWPGGLRIGRHVVDINRAVRIDRKARQQDLEDARVGLDDADLTGNHHAAEPAQEIEPLERRRKGLGRKIAEQVERRTALAQLSEDVDRAGDRPRHHLVEAGAVGVDQLGLVGMLELEQAGAFSKAAPGVLASVPFMGADIRQKMLHRRLVSGKQLAVEVPRVPIDQHAADIEDHDVSYRLRHLPALDIPNRGTITGPCRRSNGTHRPWALPDPDGELRYARIDLAAVER